MNPRDKILIINGHPDPESYNKALALAYEKGALATGAEVRSIHLHQLKFQVVLSYGYRKRTELEPDLQKAQDSILWANHIVWFYPVWWGSLPALLKGFIDRVFLPGFAFKKRENSLFWDKLLVGKSAHIISTMDQPTWYYWLVYRAPSHRAMKLLTLEFSGIRPVKITSIGPIRLSKDSFRKKHLDRMESFGRKRK
ncbi:NADPH dehydrogenase [Leptospira ryugenii]|uniref:NADPH dehydrogenase n=1 Tax=Leptospira ryugenii TaxID=1917863 RepID=A0A2P2DXG1_9LEPT|nr:NAD(P)H-dependent oxidoreductase [Leptospira ryugenii]GBF49318.1 NADPH dehydrogenase [Leptospira ryugenii]